MTDKTEDNVWTPEEEFKLFTQFLQLRSTQPKMIYPHISDKTQKQVENKISGLRRSRGKQKTWRQQMMVIVDTILQMKEQHFKEMKKIYDQIIVVQAFSDMNNGYVINQWYDSLMDYRKEVAHQQQEQQDKDDLDKILCYLVNQQTINN